MANVSEILNRHLENIKNRIQTELAVQGRNASGKTSSSLSVQVNGEKGTLFGSETVGYLEKGRGPGNAPRDFVSTIKDWIKAKGISVTPIQSKRKSQLSPYERGLNSLAGAIAYTIMKKGTKLHREHRNKDIYSTAIEEELDSMARELSLNLGVMVEQINDRLNI